MSPVTAATTFEVLAFRALPATGAVAVLELEGRFSAGTSHRLGRPRLRVEGTERIECDPVGARDAAAGPGGVPWRASFALAIELVDEGAGYMLAVGRDLLVELPAPDFDHGADDLPRLARLAREANELRRLVDETRAELAVAEDRARRAADARRRVEADLAQVRVERDEARAEVTAASAAREEALREVERIREEADADIIRAGQEAALKLEAVQAAHAAALEKAQAEAEHARTEGAEAVANERAAGEGALEQAREEFAAELERVRADAETRLASAVAAAETDRTAALAAAEREHEADLDVARAGVAAARRDLEAARAELEALRAERARVAPATVAGRSRAVDGGEGGAERADGAPADPPADSSDSAESTEPGDDGPHSPGIADPHAAGADHSDGAPDHSPAEPTTSEHSLPRRAVERARASLFRDPDHASEAPTLGPEPAHRRHDPSVVPTEAIDVDEGVRVLSPRPRRRHDISDEREPEHLAPGATRIGARSMDRTIHRHRVFEPQRIGALVALAIAVAAFVLVVVLRVGPL